MKIGIVRLSAIGDCVLASPIIGALRERYPQAHLTWIVKSSGEPAVRGLPHLNGIIRWDDKASRRGARRFLVALQTRCARFDVLLELHVENKLTAFILKGSGARRRIGGTSSSSLSQRYFTDMVTEKTREHALLFYWRRAILLDIAADAPERFYPYVPLTNGDREIANQYLRSSGIDPQHRLILLNLGATKEEKRWPRARFAELAHSLITSDPQARILVSGGPADTLLLAEFSTELERVLKAHSDTSARSRIVVAAGQLSLMQMAAAAERCSLFVSADTGPMHIAAAVGAPLLALFGPTDARRTAPVHKPGNAPIHVIDAREIAGVPAPMDSVQVSAVFDQALNFLNGKASSKGCFVPRASDLFRD